MPMSIISIIYEIMNNKYKVESYELLISVGLVEDQTFVYKKNSSLYPWLTSSPFLVEGEGQELAKRPPLSVRLPSIYMRGEGLSVFLLAL